MSENNRDYSAEPHHCNLSFLTTKNMLENNRNCSTESYGLEEDSDEERIADQAEEKTDPENMKAESAKQPNDQIKQTNLGSIADPATKQKSTLAISNRIKIQKQNYETQVRWLECLTSAIQKLTQVTTNSRSRKSLRRKRKYSESSISSSTSSSSSTGKTGKRAKYKNLEKKKCSHRLNQNHQLNH